MPCAGWVVFFNVHQYPKNITRQSHQGNVISGRANQQFGKLKDELSERARLLSRGVKCPSPPPPPPPESQYFYYHAAPLAQKLSNGTLASWGVITGIIVDCYCTKPICWDHAILFLNCAGSTLKIVW